MGHFSPPTRARYCAFLFHNMALEQPKKPVGGSYGQFVAAKRSEFMKACQGKKASAVSQFAAEAWKKLSEADKAPYQKLYEAAKSKFDIDMAAFLKAGGEQKKGTRALATENRKAKEDPNFKAKRAKKMDPNRPKRPAGGGYGCYLSKHREALQKECPGSIAAVGKLAGSRWKALSEKEKEPYEQEFQRKKAAYEEAMKTYVPPGGEDAGDDEDVDEDNDEDVCPDEA